MTSVYHHPDRDQHMEGIWVQATTPVPLPMSIKPGMGYQGQGQVVVLTVHRPYPRARAKATDMARVSHKLHSMAPNQEQHMATQHPGYPVQ